MSVENIPVIEGMSELACSLSELWDFSIEKVWISELLPYLEAKNTFVATSFIENVCWMNPQAVKILNKAV